MKLKTKVSLFTVDFITTLTHLKSTLNLRLCEERECYIMVCRAVSHLTSFEHNRNLRVVYCTKMMQLVYIIFV